MSDPKAWGEWKAPDASVLDTFSIHTTTANKLVEQVHERMPVVLAPGEYEHWLSKHLTDPSQLESLYQPFPAEVMESYPMSDFVNSPRNNSPEYIQRGV